MVEGEIHVGDEFRSNNGAGPLRAKIMGVGDEWVEMERWDERPIIRLLHPASRKVRFRVKKRTLGYDTCGWVRAPAVPAPLTPAGEESR